MNSLRHIFTVSCLALTLTVTSHAAEKQVGIGPSFKGPVGLQLYSLRAQLTRNAPAGLDLVKQMGIVHAELAGTYNLSPEKFNAMLDERGIKPISTHFPWARYQSDLDGVVREAKALGVKYAGVAWVMKKPPFDEAQAREAIAVFNRAGAALAKEGIQFMYHCHGYEFLPHGDGTLMDLILRETDPKLVKFEMDVLWVVYPGEDPVKWLEKYPGRWELMHLKDLKRGVSTGDRQSGKTDVENDVALGTGHMNWPAILKAARKSGVKWYFIEDESSRSAEQIPQSLKFLEQVKF
jgi:sugar phosphate isomerase/epimerase